MTVNDAFVSELGHQPRVLERAVFSSGTGFVHNEGSSQSVDGTLSQSPGKPPHIMCVDDEQDILSVAKLALETVGGYQVTTCCGGTVALERVRDIKPDLILLDVMMPHLSGPATLRELRNIDEFSSTPIIFMTARVQPHEVEEYLKLGASAVVHKPFDPMQLAGQIGEVLKNLKN